MRAFAASAGLAWTPDRASPRPLGRGVFDACRGIPSHLGRSIEAIEQTGGDCIATLGDGGREHFDPVIGADGLHSRIREMPRYAR